MPRCIFTCRACVSRHSQTRYVVCASARPTCCAPTSRRWSSSSWASCGNTRALHAYAPHVLHGIGLSSVLMFILFIWHLIRPCFRMCCVTCGYCFVPGRRGGPVSGSRLLHQRRRAAAGSHCLVPFLPAVCHAGHAHLSLRARPMESRAALAWSRLEFGAESVDSTRTGFVKIRWQAQCVGLRCRV
jgi:hypothetical protein